MTRKQKTWMWIFLAMFLIPEILWSPVANFYYQLPQTSRSGATFPFRDNFLQNPDNLNYLRFVLLLQLIGTLFLLVIVMRGANLKNKLLKYLIGIILGLLTLGTGFVLLFALTFSISIM